MKRIIASALITVCVAIVFVPVFSRANITPYFMAVNDTLLPFRTDTMPYISGGDIFVPDKVFEGLEVFAIGSDESEFVRLYRGFSKYVDFYTATGVTEDQDGNNLSWPPARRIGRRFYVPLRQVCSYFDLTYEIIEIPRTVIEGEQMWVVRIISSTVINGPTFVGLNKNAIRKAYNDYYTTPSPSSPSPQPTNSSVPSPTSPTPVDQEEETTPDIIIGGSILLSFFDVSTQSAGGVLDLLDIQTSYSYHSCFFVSADDISRNPAIIRRIAGSGHMIGIMLAKGTYNEYLEVSGLLFEVAKVKTVLVSGDESVLTDRGWINDNGLILWESPQSLADTEDPSLNDVIESLPRDIASRTNLMFSCSGNAASILPGIISYLRENNYTLERITETTAPLK